MLTYPSLPVLGKDDVFPVRTLDGSYTLFSNLYQSAFHSLNGAVSESKHVFIQNGLLTQSFRSHINVLEFGFGTGLNCLLTCLFAQKHNRPIHYKGLDKFIIPWSVVKDLQYPAYLSVPASDEPWALIHHETKGSFPNFSFSKHTDIHEIGEFRADCIYFDAFDPLTHPEAWDQETFQHLYSITSSGGCLVTYCAQGQVRRNLLNAGFTVERLPGAPGKRQMLRAIRPLYS